MTPARRSQTVFLVLLVGTILSAAVLFGAVAEVPLPGGGPRIDIRHLFVGLVLALGGAALLAAPRERRPRAPWIAALAALPLWATLSLVELPLPVLETIAPERAAAAVATPAGPLEGCDEQLVDAAYPTSAPLTFDTTLTRQTVFYMVAAGIAFLASFAFFSGHRARLLALAVTLSMFGFAESVYGLWQWASGTPMVLWQEKTAFIDSATGTLINRNHFAQLVYIGFAATLALLLLPRPTGRDVASRERAMAIRVALGLAATTQLAAILASRSRAGFGCAVIVLLAGGIVFVRRRGRLHLLESLLALAVLVPLAIVTIPPVLERMAAVSQEWTSAAGRGEVFRTSSRIIAEHPVFGTGAGTFSLIWGGYRPPAIQGAYNYAHNDYLQVLIETGIPGLALALLPLLLFAAGTWKRGRWTVFEDPLGLPLLGALAAVALHEIVDFGLQIPSNLMLVAVLAGALAPSPLIRTPRRGGRVAAAVAVTAIALAPLAALHSLARWPALAGRIGWPDPPSIRHRIAGEQFDRWREQMASDPEAARVAACSGLEQEARAIVGRLFSATYRTGYATRAAALLASGVIARPRPAVEAAITAAADQARRLDPWNARHRNRLLRVALALGQFDRAFADADAAVRTAAVSRRMIRDLLKLGLPTAMVARIAKSRPVPYRELLAELWRAGDRDTLAFLVPPDVTPDPARCFAGGQVRAVLRRIHRRDARPFLEGCLDLLAGETPVEGDRDRRRDQVLSWLALEALDDGDVAEAERYLARMARGAARDLLELRVAQARRDWNRVGALARSLLHAGGGSIDPRTAARYHALIGESLARRGRYGDALTELRRALHYDPGSRRYRRLVRELEDGNDPYPPLAPPPPAPSAGKAHD